MWRYFEEDLGYNVEDRQQDDLGYDLLATNGDKVLCIEVKGRSGPDPVADFTVNEYRKILDYQERRFTDGEYHICIVTNALQAPELHHFELRRFKKKKGQNRLCEWRRMDGGMTLSFDERTAARATAETETES